jgi:phosphonate transport system substrate-binding protein
MMALPLVLGRGLAEANHGPVRFGVTPAFLHDRHDFLESWRHYMIRWLGNPVDFIQRDSYRETMDLLRLEQLDFAWICDYPYLHLKPLLRLVVVPHYRGRPIYHSYLIVHAGNGTTTGYADLRGAIFAYADPYSNTGYLVPRYRLHQLGEDPNHFFRKTFFTWSHRKVVEAVASGLATAGAVDSYVWDTLQTVEPQLTAGTRVVWQSPGYGFPPIVAHVDNVSDDHFREVQQLLLEMAENREGKALLASLNLDRFSIESPALYDSVGEMMRAFGEFPAT